MREPLERLERREPLKRLERREPLERLERLERREPLERLERLPKLSNLLIGDVIIFVPRFIVSPAIEISPCPSLPNKLNTFLLVLPTIGTRPVILPTSLDMLRTAFPLLELIRLIMLRLLRVPFFLRPPRNFILYTIIRLLFIQS